MRGALHDMLVAGAAWTAKADSPEDTGRQPLAVEVVTATHAAELIPGVITTTPHARYLSLHARVAVEAGRRGWTRDDQQKFRHLLRRCEVVMAAISLQHAHDDQNDHVRRAGVRGPHGVNTISRWLGENGAVDIGELSRTYSTVAEGFFATYGGIETTLGLLEPGVIPAPGPAADVRALSELDPIIRLADGPGELSAAALTGADNLCLCRVGSAPDGANLRRAYFSANAPDPELSAVHRNSAGVLVAALAGQPTSDNVDALMDRFCCFTPEASAILKDPDLEAHALLWRGALLRNWSVWAWRMVWAVLVDPLQQPGTTAEAADAFVNGLPQTTVGQALKKDLPQTVAGTGVLRPAEKALNEEAVQNGQWSPLLLLQLLAVGANRVDELDGSSREAFLRYGQIGLGPDWVRDWIEEHAALPLSDAARSLALALFSRAERVSREKMQWTRTGLRMPTRLRVIGDRLRLEGREGYAPASLRLDTFANVLHQLGILALSEDGGSWIRGPHDSGTDA